MATICSLRDGALTTLDHSVQAIESDLKLNAKLDILTRLQAAKTPRRVPVSPSEIATSPNYDDSDEEDQSTEREDTRDEEEEGGESGEVEQMLLSGQRDVSRVSLLTASHCQV